MTGLPPKRRAIAVGMLLLAACSGTIPVPTQEPPASGGPQLCLLASTTGRLVADARWGIALEDPTGFVHEVIWPYGYTARRDGGGTVLLNAAGQVIAGVGDTVTMGGGEVGSSRAWLACPQGFQVVDHG